MVCATPLTTVGALTLQSAPTHSGPHAHTAVVASQVPFSLQAPGHSPREESRNVAEKPTFSRDRSVIKVVAIKTAGYSKHRHTHKYAHVPTWKELTL
jgi:hypothetical protein